jgi:hypothetical protein
MTLRAGMIPKKADFDGYRKALRRIESEAAAQRTWLPKTCAAEYRDDLSKAIITQKYAGGYPDYHPWYAYWKQMVSGSTGQFWILFGDLLKSITTVHRSTGGGRAGWFAGVPSSARDSGGKSWFGTKKNPRGKSKSIGMYAAVNEDLRPVFEPSIDEYAKTHWLRRSRNSLNAIVRLWR